MSFSNTIDLVNSTWLFNSCHVHTNEQIEIASGSVILLYIYMFRIKIENTTLYCVKIKRGRKMSSWQIVCVQCVLFSSGKLVLSKQWLYHFKPSRKREAQIYFLDKLSWDNSRKLVGWLFHRNFLWRKNACAYIFQFDFR